MTPTTSSMTPSCSSDIRLKKDIHDADSALPWLAGFHVRDYMVRVDGSKATGVIAQELQETHPEMVRMGEDGYYTVDGPNPWKLVKAFQEQQTQIESLKAANDNAAADIAALRQELAALKSARK
jgi:Chaperone of endosialidase